MSKPASVALGYVPFIVCSLLALTFSTLYILWFRSTRGRDRSRTTTVVSISALIVTLLAAALVPVDVFLVSCMKNANGTYKEWAEDASVRRSIGDRVTYTYYTIYGLILAFVFLLLPLNFFFHTVDGDEDVDDEAPPEEEPWTRRFVRAAKYTLASLFLFGLLVALGMLIPSDDDGGGGGGQGKAFLLLLDSVLGKEFFSPSRGQNMLLFMLNVLCVIGMFLLIFYTGYGMSVLPCGMIVGSDSVGREVSGVEEEIARAEGRLREIKAELAGDGEGATSPFDASAVERLERELRLLNRTRHELRQASRTAVNRCLIVCRPFQLVFGAAFALMGFLIFLSLLLTSIDKAIHSNGARSGYALHNGTLPNPLDVVLVCAQSVYPLDYLLYCCLVLFFVFSSMAGIQKVGIRFVWLSVYKIRAHRTKPQALVLLCMSLMFILLAVNVVMYSVVPDYTTYGSQHYMVNKTVGNDTVAAEVKKCSLIEAPSTMCDMTRIAVLLLGFGYRSWIFGAAYYWLGWGFLLAILLGSVLAVCRRRRRPPPGGRESGTADDEQGLVDEDVVFDAADSGGGSNNNDD